MGQDFFRRSIELSENYMRPGQTLLRTIETTTQKWMTNGHPFSNDIVI